MDLTEAVSDLNNFGIDLKLEEYDDEVFYSSALREWFDLNCDYEIYLIDEREFGLELEGENIATIYIQDSVLRIRPLGDNPYGVLLDVLEFVAQCHKKTVAALGKLKELTFEEVGEIDEQTVDMESASEEDSDDWEWI